MTNTGRLMAMGTLFVSGPIYEQRTSAGELQYVLPLVQRDGAGVMSVTAIWLGPAADNFMNLHRGHCKPGQPLSITFDRLFCHRNELHGIVGTCTLAPGRWEGRGAGGTDHTTTHNEESHA